MSSEMAPGGAMPAITPEFLANTPVSPPPPGVPYNYEDIKANFINPETNAPAARAVICVFLVLMVIVLVLRLYSRFVVIRKTGFDDWIALGAGAFGIAVTGVALDILATGGFGPHSWNVPLAIYFSPRWNRDLFMMTLFTPIASGLAKVSILLFILRIFPRLASPKIAYAVYGGLVLNVLAYTALTLATFILCTPRSGEGGQLPLKCTPKVRMDIGIGSAAINAGLDLYVLAIAIPSLWSLQLPLRRKIGACLVLATGLVACAFSIVSLYLRAGTDGNDDPSRKQVLPLIITILENQFSIITSCLPALPVLWKDVSTKLGSSVRRILSMVSTNNKTSGSRTTGFELGSQSHSSTKSLNMHSTVKHEADLEEGPHDPYKIRVTTSIHKMEGRR